MSADHRTVKALMEHRYAGSWQPGPRRSAGRAAAPRKGAMRLLKSMSMALRRRIVTWSESPAGKQKPSRSPH